MMFQWLKDLLKVYTLRDFWILLAAPSAIMGIWVLFCLLLRIPIVPIRAILIWLLIFVLTVLSAVAGEGWRKGVEKYAA